MVTIIYKFPAFDHVVICVFRAMATSKFEPVDARKAFPCFDEPNLKATFTITLVHQPDFTALSNTPAVEEKVCGRRDGNNLYAQY